MAKLASVIDELIEKEFIPFLEKTTKIDAKILLSSWREFNKMTVEKQPKAVEEPKVEQKPVATYTNAELEILKISDLKAICETLRLPKGGLKQQLIQRIMAQRGTSRPLDFCGGQPPAKKQKIVPECIAFDDDELDMELGKIDMAQIRMPDVTIVKNSNGHWINEETKIVFTEDEQLYGGIKSRLAIGFEDEDGHVEDLNAEKIELCNEYMFRYKEPDMIMM